MANYLLVYSGGDTSMPESEEEQASVMAAWGAWFEQLGSAVVDGGNPMSGERKTVANDGSVSNGAPEASGYSILEADSLDAATEMAKGCPVLQTGQQISVYETFKVM